MTVTISAFLKFSFKKTTLYIYIYISDQARRVIEMHNHREKSRCSTTEECVCVRERDSERD